MANELYERLFESKLVARTVILEFKTIKFDNKQRSTTFQHYIFEKQDIIKASVELLKHLWPINEPSRLIGIRFMHLRSRANAVRAPNNKSDIVDLSDDATGLPFPIPIVQRVSSDDGANRYSHPTSLLSQTEEDPNEVLAHQLQFDRSRMNSSNRKAIDYFKQKKETLKKSHTPIEYMLEDLL